MENQRPTPFTFRKRLFIDPSFQGKLLLGIAFAALLSIVLLVVDYYVVFGRNSVTGAWDPEMIWIFTKSQRPLIIQLVIFVFVLCIVTTVLSHRVAGPIYSLERSMRLIQGGNLGHRARFRKRDELSHLRDAFNAMMSSIHGQVAGDRENADLLRREVETLLSKTDLDSQTKQKLQEIKARLESLTRGFTL